jgi:uncharacterized membrane protein
MRTGRLEAFSDGVIAILITIMVLELKVPLGAPHFGDLKPVLGIFLSYVLSFGADLADPRSTDRSSPFGRR